MPGEHPEAGDQASRQSEPARVARREVQGCVTAVATLVHLAPRERTRRAEDLAQTKGARDEKPAVAKLKRERAEDRAGLVHCGDVPGCVTP